MSAFRVYMFMQAKKEAAYQAYNYAAAKLDLATRDEREAELDSQHEPMATIRAMNISERDKILCGAYYVSHGRLPKQKEGEQEDG